MLSRRMLAVLLAVALAPAARAEQTSYEERASRTPGAELASAGRGPGRSPGFDVLREVWWDAVRDRAVPVKAYVPRGAGPFPTIVFSHGLGATREGYSYLAEHWARAGFAVVSLQHAGTDGRVFKPGLDRTAAMKAALARWDDAIARPLDVRFAIDRLAAQQRAGRGIGARLDLARLGVAGHSFGAWTSLVIVGMRISPVRQGGPLAPASAFSDPRVKAAVALSAPVQREKPGSPSYREVYGGVHRPVLVMTGDRDLSPVGDLKAAERRIPYDHLPGEAMLVTFAGGDHWIFSGRGFKVAPKPMDPEFQELIRSASTAFWRAYLCGEPSARRWLRGDGYRQELGTLGRFEVH